MPSLSEFLVTTSVEEGIYYGQTAHNRAFKDFSSVPFTENQSLFELVYSPQDSEISPEFLEIDSKYVKITLRVARSRRLSSHKVAIFRPDFSKPSVKKFFLYPFH